MTAPPSSIVVADILDASIDKFHSTLFVNIGLSNGVLLRTVLDSLSGQLTDTRTRYVVLAVILCCYSPLSTAQFPGIEARSARASTDQRRYRYPRPLESFMAQLQPSEYATIHSPHFRHARPRLEFLRRTLSRRTHWYHWKRSEVRSALADIE